MTVSRELLKALRDRTQAGLVDCQRALTEAGGDLDAAVACLARYEAERAATALANRAAVERQLTARPARADVVARYVALGYYDAAGIVRRVREHLSLPVTMAAGLAREVDEACAAKRAALAGWPPMTDCDRLDRAFAALWADRFIALQNAGFTRTDGHECVDDEVGANPAAWGYCFFHLQDVERAVRGEGLTLAFGAIRGDHDDEEAGRAVSRALVAAGLAPVWSGAARERITLPALVWQRRGPEIGVELRAEVGARAAHFCG